jgi:hypothetical protein
LRGAAQIELAAHDAERVVLEPDDAFRRGDLGAQRREIDGGGDHVRRQGQIRGLELEALELGLRRLGFDLAAHAAEDVGSVGDVERGGGHAEHLVEARLAERDPRKALLLRRGVAGEGGKQAALLRVEVFPRLTQ